jgi:phytol kinase
VINLIFILALYTFDVLFVELLYRLKFSAFYTRKIGHIIGALIAILMVQILPFWAFIFICGVLILINLVSHKFHIFGSIENAEKNSIGTLLYPISLLILGLIFWEYKLVYIGSVAVMGFADSAAAVVGKSIGRHRVRFSSKKTLEGFFAFFAVSLIIFLTILVKNFGKLDPLQLLLAILVSFSLAIVEFVSKKGSDNISIPLLSSVFLYILIN